MGNIPKPGGLSESELLAKEEMWKQGAVDEYGEKVKPLTNEEQIYLAKINEAKEKSNVLMDKAALFHFMTTITKNVRLNSLKRPMKTWSIKILADIVEKIG